MSMRGASYVVAEMADDILTVYSSSFHVELFMEIY